MGGMVMMEHQDSQAPKDQKGQKGQKGHLENEVHRGLPDPRGLQDQLGKEENDQQERKWTSLFNLVLK